MTAAGEVASGEAGDGAGVGAGVGAGAVSGDAAGRVAGDLLLVLNCGSSSIKFALFDAAAEPLLRRPLWSGQARGIGGTAPEFVEDGRPPAALGRDHAHPHAEALHRIRERVDAKLGGCRLAGVAHRVVHGGSTHAEPVRVDAAALAELERCIPLAPLHQPFALDAIRMLMTEQPELVQIACFDTAFHHTAPRVEQMLPLPRRYWEQGVRRYGFHGLSYAYMAVALDERHGVRARGRTIVAHLGSGASLCAMHDLRSVATTMGFSALDGLMMGTRTGSIDPGVLLHLLDAGMTAQQVSHLLYEECGLLGVSGLSSDPRVLLEHEAGRDAAHEGARDALALYVRRIVREIGALVAVLGGLDLLVFTAGVGEHNAPIRKRVCEAFGFLGAALDDAANARHAPVISTATSKVTIGVEPTNEEWIIARQSLGLLRGTRPRSRPI